MRPRSIGVEHVAYEALWQLQLDKKLREAGSVTGSFQKKTLLSSRKIKIVRLKPIRR